MFPDCILRQVDDINTLWFKDKVNIILQQYYVFISNIAYFNIN